MLGKRHPSRGVNVGIAGLAIAGVFVVSAAIPYFLIRDGDPTSRAQSPTDSPAGVPTGTPIHPDDTAITPEPGATPDTSIPFWYVPYVNADRQRPHFEGQLNGYEIIPGHIDTRTPFEVCPPDGFTSPSARDVESLGPATADIMVDAAALPAGFRPLDGPWVWACDGEIVISEWLFSVAPGTEGANPGGGSMAISRTRGQSVIAYGAPEVRWVATAVAGYPAILSGPIVEAADGQFGSCYLAVYLPETDVLTQVTGSASNAALCLQVAEGLVR